MTDIEETRREWIADAVGYMYKLGLFTQEEVYDALCLAENLHYHCDICTAEEAVDEEITYWGE